jgi:hypothetical protein
MSLSRRGYGSVWLIVTILRTTEPYTWGEFRVGTIYLGRMLICCGRRSLEEPPWLACGTPCRNHLPGENVELLGEEELGGTTLVGLWNPHV